MSANDNSVNIKSDSNYHHGDLRAVALAAGMARIREQPRPDLGLRALAREIGVSATALYRHFPNKDALLDALAMTALEQLGKSQADAGVAAGGGRTGFEEVGFTYVKWAVQNPALLRLIYTRIGQVNLDNEDDCEMGEAFRQLQAGIAAVMPDTLSPKSRKVAALHAWSLVHGLSMLILDGQVEWDETLVRDVVTSAQF